MRAPNNFYDFESTFGNFGCNLIVLKMSGRNIRKLQNGRNMSISQRKFKYRILVKLNLYNLKRFFQILRKAYN